MNGDVKSKGKEPMVEDENDDDGEAGPELPPDFDAEDIPDDEEGRFFGGGMERQTAQAMQWMLRVWISPRNLIPHGCDDLLLISRRRYQRMPNCAENMRMTRKSMRCICASSIWVVYVRC